MDDALRDRVDRASATVFGVAADRLWTPGIHVGAGGTDRVVVARLDTSTRVLVPPDQVDVVRAALAHGPPTDLMRAESWTEWLGSGPHRFDGPFTHAYVGRSTHLEQARAVEQIAPWRLGRIRADTPADEWSAAGFDGEPEVVYGLFTDRVIAAAANLRLWDGVPVDVGVLTHPQHRGLGYGATVAAGAARFAVVEHGAARLRVPRAAGAVTAIARRLGFEDHEAALTITLAP